MQPPNCDGTFIVFEGADGAGTTTQSKRLAEEIGAFWTKEPTETAVGTKVDEMIEEENYSPETIALGFATDRMIHVEDVIRPRLEQGETVICDRYYHSSLVYQPILGADRRWVKQLNRSAITPDMTIILDIGADEGMKRITSRGKDDNIFEDLTFQEKVVKRYRELSKELEDPIKRIDASSSIDEVYNRVKEIYNSLS